MVVISIIEKQNTFCYIVFVNGTDHPMECLMDNEMVVGKLKEICNSFEDILGLVILFGSYSRKEEIEGSDIDLYIEPKDMDMTTLKFGQHKRYKEFKYALYDSFPNQFDLLAYGGKRDLASIRKTSLWKQIQNDGVTIYDKRTTTV